MVELPRKLIYNTCVQTGTFTPYIDKGLWVGTLGGFLHSPEDAITIKFQTK